MYGAIRAQREQERAEIAARNAKTKAKAARPRSVGATTCQRIHATLRSALSAAVEAGEVPRNAAKLANRQVPRGSRPEVKVWEPAVLGEFLDALEGAASGSTRSYTWQHSLGFGAASSAVDLDAGTITVDWQHATAGYVVIEGAPKTDGSEAAVDIDAGTIRALKRWRAVQAAERLRWGPAWSDSGLVFTREDGNAYHPDNITKRFQRLVAKHGLPRTRLHDLRHLAASLQLAAGVDIAIVSKRLRHSSVGITSDTYSHLIGDVGREAAERAAAMVPRRASGSRA
jgi:integrase